MSDFPYPGLRPFGREETDIFFGREGQIDELLERLGDGRFLAIVGPSGCGKSSLVKAGLIPALETGFLATAGVRWRTASMRPGNRPLTALARALCGSSALGGELGDSEHAAAFLLANLRRGPLSLVETVREAGLPAGTNLLLLVDQFEEIFRYRRENDDEAAAFAAMLLATAGEPASGVFIVLTMRSDFLGDCTLFHGLPEMMNDSQFLTPRLSRDGLRECVEGPAGVFGGRIEPSLSNRILNDMGPDPDQLPLMQHALMRMWMAASGRTTGSLRREDLDLESRPKSSGPVSRAQGVELSVSDYEAVGTLAEALSKHADAAFESLDEEGQRIAERMFRSLSERGQKSRDTRRPTRLGEVAAVADVPPEAVIEVVEVFRAPGRSFVTPPVGVVLDEDSILDISHESLIRQWKTMTGWVEAESRSGETYLRLEETARLWKRHLAAPWRRPDLDMALTWKVLEQPTEEWSKRYGSDFELAMEFLDASEEERKERQREREEASQRELEQARALAEAEKKKADAERELAREQATIIKRLRKFSVAIGATAIVAVLGVILALSLLANLRARDRQLTESRLSTRAILALPTDPRLAVLLAAEARHDVSRGAKQSALQETTLLRVLSGFYNVRATEGFEEGARAVAFSPANCEGQEWFAVLDRRGRVAVWPGGIRPAGVPDTAEAPRLLDLQISADCRLAALDERGLVRLWDSGFTTAPTEFQATGKVHGLLFSPPVADDPAGHWLAAYGAGGVQLWEAAGGVDQAGSRIEMPASQVAFAVDGLHLAVASGSEVVLWRLADGATRRGAYRHTLPVTDLEFSPEGKWLATSSGRTARLWKLDDDPSTVAPVELRGHRALITSLAFSPDPQADKYWLATGSLDDSLRLWDLGRLEKPDPARTPKEIPHPAGVTTLAFRPPDGRWIATGGEDDKVRVWDITTLATSDPVELPHGETVSLIAFNADGSRLASGSSARPTKVWRLDQPTALPQFVPYEGKVAGIAFRGEGSGTPWLATASRYALTLHDPAGEQGTGADPEGVTESPSKFVQVGFSRDGLRLASRREDNVVEWRATGDMGLGEAVPMPGPRVAMSQSLDGAWLVTVRPSERLSGNDEIWLSDWSLGSDGAPQERLVREAPGRAMQVAVGGSSDNGDEPRWLAAAGLDGVVWLWDLDSPAADPHPLRHEDRVSSLAFSPTPGPDEDGNVGQPWLVTGDWDDAAHIWTLDAGPPEKPHKQLQHPDAVRVVRFSPDGLWLATGSGDHRARLWSVADDFIEVLSIDHRDAVISLAFDPDGQWFASGSLDNLLRILPLGRELLHGTACRAAAGVTEEQWAAGDLSEEQRAAGNLTEEEWRKYLPGQRYHLTCD